MNTDVDVSNLQADS